MSSFLFCHQCSNRTMIRGDEAFLSEGVPECPLCHSEFVEIIDGPPGPRTAMEHTAGGGARRQLASRLEDLFNIAITGQDGERGDDAGPATEQLVRNILGLLLPSNLSDLLGASTSGGITAGDFVLGSMDEIIARLADQHDNPARPASRSAVASLPRVKVPARAAPGGGSQRAPGDDVPVAESVQEGDKCIICTDEYEVDQQVIKMPCQHVFHEDCLDKWLNINNTCPVCRHELPEEAEPSRRQSPGNGSGGRPGEDEESGSDYNSSEGSGSEGTFSEGTESEGSGTPSGDGMDHYALDAGLSDALYIIGRRLRGHAAGGRDSGSAAEVDTSFEDSETGESGSESDSMPSLASASELDDSMPSLASASELQSHRSGSPRPPSVGAASRPSRAEGSDDDAGSDVPPPPLPPEAVGSGRVVAPPTGRLPAPGRAAEAAPTAADLRTPPPPAGGTRAGDAPSPRLPVFPTMGPVARDSDDESDAPPSTFDILQAITIMEDLLQHSPLRVGPQDLDEDFDSGSDSDDEMPPLALEPESDSRSATTAVADVATAAGVRASSPSERDTDEESEDVPPPSKRARTAADDTAGAVTVTADAGTTDPEDAPARDDVGMAESELPRQAPSRPSRRRTWLAAAVGAATAAVAAGVAAAWGAVRRQPRKKDMGVADARESPSLFGATRNDEAVTAAPRGGGEVGGESA